MTGRFFPFAALTLAVLGACSASDRGTTPPADAETSQRTETGADGRCYAVEPIPAIYEQVPGQVQVVQAEIAEDGTVIRPPIYRNASVPRIVRPRGEIRFAVPCRERVTPELVASVQRALKVRGLYAGPVTGEIDAGTEAAIRAYQSDRGLDSGRLSLETARALGLIEVPRPAPDAEE
ncbi:Putative peptidoglycan binding domain protein [Roseivivax jejudonensis]|uniref:Putative peptidoglycan binding domain protein n=1 Tax=Roseivivax jejudonensis TaxID=1529041 RepID=A0A1X6ZFS8_9RHOB|nr:peptidoglycan-binding domain-containing protein [Roseivivax jejudonensis]SLN50457.1 Putative peptidoglycan binding domain protein [Roseivivax jejudonensis]